jgi:putative hydrolase of the HAD superfamily
MIEWLLVDYGETISTPLPADAINDLADLAGMPRGEFLHRYWKERPAYDLGQPTTTYWSRVLDRDPDELAPVLVELNRTDIHGWLHLNSLTLRTLLAHACRTGVRLALLSNAPEPLAAAIERSSWSRHFAHRFYSCRLQRAKPDPSTFTTVLTHLQADPRDVLFIDDKVANTLAAETLGMPTITFTSANTLGRELRLS